MSDAYSHSTASDEWHRESERHGMERDKREQLKRFYDYPTEPEPNPLPTQESHQSYEDFWREITKDQMTWWDKWKAQMFESQEYKQWTAEFFRERGLTGKDQQ